MPLLLLRVGSGLLVTLVVWSMGCVAGFGSQALQRVFLNAVNMASRSTSMFATATVRQSRHSGTWALMR